MPRSGPTLRTPAALAAAGLIAPERAAELSAVAARYAVALTPETARAAAARPDGPVARQYLPDPAELLTLPDEADDPIGDAAHAPVPGVVHRYRDRVLLKPTQTCAVYCRFCFRRAAVGPGQGALGPAALDRALGYIAAHPEIWEVILSGGDPMRLPAANLGRILARLGAIGHVRVLRLHTRVPVVAPERIDAAMLAALTGCGRPVWTLLHVNHADELTPAARAAIGRLADRGLPLLSQSVLLAGVNDDPAALEALFRALVELRVKPHYLHHLDRAPGTARFRVPLARARALADQLRGPVSGLCQPTLMLDLPGGRGKIPAAAPRLAPAGPGRWTARDLAGRDIDYDEGDYPDGNGAEEAAR